MDGTHAADVKKHVRSYLVVFAALLGLTIATVTVASLHLEIHEAVIVALCIALVKGTLVAAYFMHLISERKVIYTILGIVVILLLVLFFLPMLSFSNSIGVPPAQ